MAYTGQQLCDRVRDQINDDAKREIADAEILAYLNDCSKVILAERPDLRIGSLATALTDILLAGTWPWPDMTVPWAIDYATSMAQRPDDEDATQRLSDGAMKAFERRMRGPR